MVGWSSCANCPMPPNKNKWTRWNSSILNTERVSLSLRYSLCVSSDLLDIRHQAAIWLVYVWGKERRLENGGWDPAGKIHPFQPTLCLLLSPFPPEASFDLPLPAHAPPSTSTYLGWAGSSHLLQSAIWKCNFCVVVNRFITAGCGIRIP